MRIAYFNSPAYDYLTATLIEGLTLEGHVVVAQYESNYAGRPPEDFHRNAADCDIVVLAGGMGSDRGGFQTLDHPQKIYADGTDFQSTGSLRGLGARLVFKREISRIAAPGEETRLYPLPLAIERRYLPAGRSRERDIALSFIATMQTNPLRASIDARLSRLGRADVRSGSTRERAYDNASANYIPTPNYQGWLARSRMSVAMPGRGYDTARFWEILGAGAALMTWEPDIVIPHPFVDGETCVSFASLREFDEKLVYYLDRPDDVARIAAAGHAHALAHHTTAARARSFIDIVQSTWDDDFRF